MTEFNNFYRPLVGPLFAPTFFTAVLFGIATPVLPLYLQDVGASYAVIGTVISGLAIGRLLATLPSSGALSRLSMRQAMLFGLAVLTAALLSMALVDSLLVLFISWLLAGTGTALYEMARHQFIAIHIPNHHRGRAVAIVGGSFRLGNVVGPALGGWTAQLYGFRTSFLLMAGLAAATAVIVSFYLPHQPTSQEPFSLRAYAGELRSTFQANRRVLLVAGSGQLLMQLVRRSRSVILPLYAAYLGLDVAAVGIVVSIGSMLDTTMFIPAGVIVDKYGRKAAIIPSLILQALGLFLLPLASGFASLVGVAGLMGLGNGISAGTMLTLGADLAPEKDRTPFLGLWRVSNSLGFALGPNVVGAVAAMMTLPLASIAAGFIGIFAAGLFYQFIPETLKNGAQTSAGLAD